MASSVVTIQYNLQEQCSPLSEETSSHQISTSSSSFGLLTTVAQLPPKYKIRYLAQATVVETPLDLSVKPANNHIVNHNSNLINNHSANVVTSVPKIPLLSPPKKRYRGENFTITNSNDSNKKNEVVDEIELLNTAKYIRIDDEILESNENKVQKEVTPNKPIKRTSHAPRTVKPTATVPSATSITKEKKTKAMRKLKFDEDTTSPVSGTIIRPIEEITENGMDHQSGDIDPEYNIVEVTEEAKSELATIKNVIGAYVCKLCRIKFEDAFGLARHRCSCIVLLEYRCPECGKRFNCPANLASHRRWHKPKEEIFKKQQQNNENEKHHSCEECGKIFKRQAYLRKHLITHKKDKYKKNSTMKENHRQKLKSTVENGKIGVGSTSSSSLLSYKTDDSNSIESSSYYSQNTITSYYPQQQQQQQQLLEENQHNIYYYKANNNNNNNNDDNHKFYDSDYEYTPSENSSMASHSPGRLQIVESSLLTEEENIAAVALAHLRNGPSVIQHTTAAAAMAF